MSSRVAVNHNFCSATQPRHEIGCRPAVVKINALITTLRQRDLPGVDASPLCASQHMQISQALLVRNADEAVRLMRDHVRHVSSEILAHFVDSR